jgi:hypothetical protein
MGKPRECFTSVARQSNERALACLSASADSILPSPAVGACRLPSTPGERPRVLSRLSLLQSRHGKALPDIRRPPS